MAAARQTLGKKLFAGFAAVLLIAMTAIVPILMDVREILLALGAQPGQSDANAVVSALSPEATQRVAALAAHAYSYGAIGTFLLVVTSLLIAYLITRAANLPLLHIWQGWTTSLRELNGAGERLQQSESPAAVAETVKAACANAEAATQSLGRMLGADELGQGRQS